MTTAIDVKTGLRLTPEEFINLPDMEQRAELHQGVLYIVPPPSLDHQQLANRLGGYMAFQIEDPGLGYVFQPIEIVLSDDTRVAPDIVAIRAGREDIMHEFRVYGPPDIVVEVLSSNRSVDLVRKRAWYAAAGVPEYWLLDGDADTLTPLVLGDDGAYRERGLLTAADTLTTPLFPQFSLPLAQLFNHPARIRR